MLNNVFLRLSKEERAKKLNTVLRNRTNNALSSEEISALLSSISLQEQYAIHVYNDPQAFYKAVVPDDSDGIQGRVIFGQLFTGQRSYYRNMKYDAAAAVIANNDEQSGQSKCAILIYVPRHLQMIRTGMENGQGEKTAYCL